MFGDGKFQPLCSFEDPEIRPQPGWIEHDPEDLLADVGQCLDYAASAQGVGLANLGQTVLAWDADTGLPLCNAIAARDMRTQTQTS